MPLFTLSLTRHLTSCAIFLALSLTQILTFAETTYDQTPQGIAVIDALYTEHGIAKNYSQSILKRAKHNDRVLELMTPKKNAKDSEDKKSKKADFNWQRYRKIFLGGDLHLKGRAFAENHFEALQLAEQTYGVPQEIILSIMGVETRYGKITGNFLVLDALATLAFEYPDRSPFFTQELKEFILLSKEHGINPYTTKGSYAGAMGYGQFMPSSYRKYAVDFDGDGRIDLLNSPVDAIGSIANYFLQFGWQPHQPVASRALYYNKTTDNDKLLAEKKALFNKGFKPYLALSDVYQKGIYPVWCTPESLHQQNCLSVNSTISHVLPLELTWDDGLKYWIGFDNFYVITRYNHSRWYAMAVYQLSQKIKLSQ